MWKNAKPLLVILSVGLNVAFVGVWAVRAAPGWFADALPSEGDGSGDPVWCPLLRKVGASPEQWRQIEPRLLEFQKAKQKICFEIRRARADMIDLIASPDPDRDAIRAKQELIWAGQREVQNLLVEHLLSQKELLSPDQQKEFFDAMRLRMQKKCFGPCPMRGVGGKLRSERGVGKP